MLNAAARARIAKALSFVELVTSVLQGEKRFGKGSYEIYHSNLQHAL
jgi:hypothetical protein